MICFYVTVSVIIAYKVPNYVQMTLLENFDKNLY